MWSKCIEVVRAPERKWFMQLLIVVNVLGSAYGYYWYRAQLAANPLTLWPVIPDSPRSTTFLALALLLLLAGRKVSWLQAVAYTGVIKYGIWAVAMILHAWALGDSRNFTDWMLLVSHGGMAIQGVVFLRPAYISAAAVVVAIVWMVFNDAADYIFMLHPYLFNSEQLSLAMATAIGLTILLSFLLLAKQRVVSKD
ncbi:DUF1405 domain-containing protein [Metallumcola ferriviriculae]|uniref:DUF1405 domain-containing protein n=1 Tax=Metallumcola ferriviriculae TaxID=3039180 RepID=A0AAU0UJI3_9FIRM|nr:DUF1405 domain-containing protein [Desulfitibacteraceae bacterium MK1]